MVEDEGSRRRLPSWMAGVGVGVDVKESNYRVESSTCEQEKEISPSSVNCETKSKSTRKSTQEISNIKKKRRKKLEVDNNGEGELTVEDLLTIAKEYVKTDADTAELESLNRDFESENRILVTELRSSFNAPKSIEKSLAQPETTCNITSEESRTGDSAQDMLDLFLGPLLKKPLEQEKKIGFTTNDEEFRQMSQNNVGEEVVPRMKTKSSLKDKVAILLD